MRAVAVSLCALAACISKPSYPDGSESCTSFGPWGAPVVLTALLPTNETDKGPWLSADATELWYSVTDFGSRHRLMRTVRADRSQPFPPGMDVSGLVGPGQLDDDASVFVANGGLELWFNHMQGTHEIRIARRTDLTQPFGDPVDADVSDDGVTDTYDASLTADENTLVYTRGANNDPADLWIATRPSREALFGGAMPLAGLNSADDDCCATLSGDGNLMWFASGRTGNTKLYKTTRTGADSAFAAPALLEMQDMQPGIDNDEPTVSADGMTLIYTDSHGGELLEMQRSCL